MFTDKEISAYRNIKAPSDLREKIVSAKKVSNKMVYSISAVAACFIFVTVGFIISNQNYIVINGQKLNKSVTFYDTASSYTRTVSSSISVPVEIKVSRESKVSVSDGFLSIEGFNASKEVEVTSSAIIWWEIELNEADNEFTMKITDKKGVKWVTLKYENAKITVTKEKE